MQHRGEQKQQKLAESPKAPIRPATTRQSKSKYTWLAMWTLAAKQKSAKSRANARSAFLGARAGRGDITIAVGRPPANRWQVL
jgi:hypothetical protein